MPLFSVGHRKNRARRRPGEDWFAFLERVGPDRYFARVRDLVDAWFDELPSEQAEALRPRLMSRDESTSTSAFWELYLHAMLLRCGLQMEYEPQLAHSTKRPDYLVHGESQSFYLEAVLVSDPKHRAQEDKLEKPIVEALRAMDSPEFRLDFQIRKRGTRGGYLDLHNFRHREWRPAQVAAGIEPLRRIYDLRHTFATFALRAGISTFDLSRYMGASLTMIDRHYGHLARDGREHAIRLLDELSAGQRPRWTLVDAAWTPNSEAAASNYNGDSG